MIGICTTPTATATLLIQSCWKVVCDIQVLYLLTACIAWFPLKANIIAIRAGVTDLIFVDGYEGWYWWWYVWGCCNFFLVCLRVCVSVRVCFLRSALLDLGRFVRFIVCDIFFRCISWLRWAPSRHVNHVGVNISDRQPNVVHLLHHSRIHGSLVEEDGWWCVIRSSTAFHSFLWMVGRCYSKPSRATVEERNGKPEASSSSWPLPQDKRTLVFAIAAFSEAHKKWLGHATETFHFTEVYHVYQ